MPEKLEQRNAPSAFIHVMFDGYPDSDWDRWNRELSNPFFEISNETPPISTPEWIDEVMESLEESFAPLDIRFGTQITEPVTTRIVVGGDGQWFKDIFPDRSGDVEIAFQDSFGRIDSPVFVFSELLYSAQEVADAAKHGLGHTLGLDHPSREVKCETSEYVGFKEVADRDWETILPNES